VKFEGFMIMKIQNMVFWVVTLCNDMFRIAVLQRTLFSQSSGLSNLLDYSDMQ
jgi:hypothetical protein